MPNEQMNSFTVKNGFKFGFGFALGAALWKSLDKTLGHELYQRYGDRLNKK